MLRTWEALPHFAQLHSFGPNFSGWVYLSSEESEIHRYPRVQQFKNLLKHAASVSPITSPLFPFLSTSKLTSNMGSTVLVTLPHLSHFTSLWSWPANVLWMMQLQETLVLPLEVWW